VKDNLARFKPDMSDHKETLVGCGMLAVMVTVTLKLTLVAGGRGGGGSGGGW